MDKDIMKFTPFPFIVKKTGKVSYEFKCPINDILKMAIKNQMSELTAMGMLYVESSKFFHLLQ